MSDPERVGRKMCPKIILEGTRLTLKTELAFALNSHPRIVGPRKYRYHSPVISAEWCAFTNFPWGRGLINFETDERELAWETYRTWLQMFELQRYYSWIVDRFHISTRVHQERVGGGDCDVAWIDERLRAVGFRLVLCTRSPGSFAAARAERLKVSGNPRQYADLELFVAEQEAFRVAVRQSTLPLLELDMSNSDVAGAADRVADWLEETGGLWMDEEEHPMLGGGFEDLKG